MLDISKITTYQAGVFQAQAYRALKNLTNKILKKHRLTMMQWSVLGFVCDAGKAGVRTSDLAKALATTHAFITHNVNSLEDKGFVQRKDHSTDGRTKLVVLASKQKKLVDKIEADVRNELRKNLYSNITREELTAYVTVIAKFANTSK